MVEAFRRPYPQFGKSRITHSRRDRQATESEGEKVSLRMNGIDEYIPEGLPPDPSRSLTPYEQPNEKEAQPHKACRKESGFMDGLEEWLDTASAIAMLLVFGPVLLFLGVISLPITIPYSIYYLLKKAFIRSGRS